MLKEDTAMGCIRPLEVGGVAVAPVPALSAHVNSSDLFIFAVFLFFSSCAELEMAAAGGLFLCQVSFLH